MSRSSEAPLRHLETLRRIAREQRTRAEKAEQELAVTDYLLNERQRVLDAVPECPTHGRGCVPHALDWIVSTKNADSERAMDAKGDALDRGL